MGQLLNQREQELLAAARLAAAAEKADKVVAGLIRAGESTAAASQAGAAGKVKETVTGIETGAKATKQALTKDLDRLSNETGRVINTIKAALALRNRGQELNIQVKDSLLMTDPALIEYARSKIAMLLGSAEEEVASLPEVEGKEKLARAFPSLRTLVMQMIDLRIALLSPDGKAPPMKPGNLNQIVRVIRETLDQIEGATLGIADTLQFDSTISMEETLKQIKGRTTRNAAESSQRVALLVDSANHGISTIQAASDVRMHCQALKALAQEAAQTKDPAIIAKARNSLPVLIADVRTAAGAAGGEAAKCAGDLESLQLGINEMLDARTRILSVVRKFDEASDQVARGLTSLGECMLVKARGVKTGVERTTERTESQIGHWEFVQTLLGIGALAMALVIGTIVSGSISTAIRKTVGVMEAVAAGDLTQRLDDTRGDEFGQMASALNKATEATARAMKEVRDSAEREKRSELERVEAQRREAEERRRRQDDETRREQARIEEERRGKAELAEQERCRERLRQEEEGRREQAREEEERRIQEEIAGKERGRREAEERAAGIVRAKVDQLLEIVAAAAKGDLTREIEVAGNEPVDELAGGIGKMLQDLANIIGRAAEYANRFHEGSSLIAQSAQGLALGAQSQGSSVGQMTVTVAELARSIQQVKGDSLEADRLSRRTHELANQGGGAMKKSLEAMELIRGSSTKIGEIIQVISEIAQQTNLLALNAAIEAARAGEHGMGFAVVADEVRKLAERSNQAAGEVSKLIRESTKRVEEGAQLSVETGQSLSQIIQAAEATASKIVEIANETIQQETHARNVSAAIRGVTEVTQQVTAGSEEIAASSEELGGQASALRDLVGAFVVK